MLQESRNSKNCWIWIIICTLVDDSWECQMDARLRSSGQLQQHRRDVSTASSTDTQHSDLRWKLNIPLIVSNGRCNLARCRSGLPSSSRTTASLKYGTRRGTPSSMCQRPSAIGGGDGSFSTWRRNTMQRPCTGGRPFKNETDDNQSNLNGTSTDYVIKHIWNYTQSCVRLWRHKLTTWICLKPDECVTTALVTFSNADTNAQTTKTTNRSFSV